MRLLATLMVTILLSTAAAAQSLKDRFESIRRLAESRQYPAAITELQAFEAADPATFRTNNLDYLAARLKLRVGDTGGAAAMFETVRARRSILREYAAWHLARIARTSGNLVGERMLLLELLADRPGSLLSEAARQRIAESNFESKNFDGAIAAVTSMIGQAGSKRRSLDLLHAKALLFKGDTENARARFDSIIASTANPAQPDDISLEAAKALDLIEVGSEKFGKEVAKLSDYDHLRRASIYQFNRDFANARLHYLAIVNGHPSSGIAPDALYQIGRGYSQTVNFTEAVNWYERVGEQYPGHPVNKDALLQLASAYARLGKHREAVARYEKYIQTYPNDDRLDRAYLNIVDVLRDAGEETEALRRAQDAAEVFRGKPAEAQALFVQARIRLARSEWDAALADLDKLLTLNELGGSRVPGGTTRPEVSFLRGITLEERQRFSEAIDAYLSIPDGRGEYYGWRATERLRSLRAEAASTVEAKLNGLTSDSPAAPDERRPRISQALRLVSDAGQRTKILDDLSKAYAELSEYTVPALPKVVEIGRDELRKTSETPARTSRNLAEELAFLGLYDEAAPEFEASVSGSGKRLSPDQEFTLAQLYLKGDRADRAVAYAGTNFKLPTDFHPDLLPRDLARMLYPAPYRDALLAHAASREVDPRFVLSIMRQESAFRPNVKSVAAARGLMQFISDTSDRIAGEIGREYFDQNELYDPSTAILFGSHYIANLFKLFPIQPDAVAASYNGGEDNMQRWYGRARSSLPGRYVPEIAFAQSKDYVWRVMANYRMYQLLYDENLNPR